MSRELRRRGQSYGNMRDRNARIEYGLESGYGALSVVDDVEDEEHHGMEGGDAGEDRGEAAPPVSADGIRHLGARSSYFLVPDTTGAVVNFNGNSTGGSGNASPSQSSCEE